MFKKFDPNENVSGVNNAKSSVQKAIRAKVLEQFPLLEEYIEQILPKKEPLRIAKCIEHIEIVVGKDGEPLFFKQRDGPYLPHLKLLHKYPFMMPHMQADKGAIKFILSGANIMCPGLTSPGARMTKVDAETPVAVMAEDKKTAIAIGVTKMASEQILSINKGIGIETAHYLNDGLWHMKSVK